VQFTVELVFAGDTAILRCYGRLFSAEALALSHAVAPLLFEWDTVILDFSGVHAIDSGGLGTLALLHLYVRSSGRRLRYCSFKPQVNDCIERTRLNEVFDIYSSEEEALLVA
jgi:anti-sigma B factor antagonist